MQLQAPKLLDRVFEEIRTIPSIFLIASFLTFTTSALQGIDNILILKISGIFFGIALLLILAQNDEESCKTKDYKNKFPIEDLGRKFDLIWVGGVGFLIEIKSGKDNRKSAIVRWIASWRTASDLKFLGYKSNFDEKRTHWNKNNEKEAIDEMLKSRLSYILRRKLNVQSDNWTFGEPIHTRGIPGS